VKSWRRQRPLHRHRFQMPEVALLVASIEDRAVHARCLDCGAWLVVREDPNDRPAWTATSILAPRAVTLDRGQPS
jgi:hypothetical protein